MDNDDSLVLYTFVWLITKIHQYIREYIKLETQQQQDKVSHNVLTFYNHYMFGEVSSLGL